MTVFLSADGCSRVLLTLEMRGSQREESARWRMANLPGNAAPIVHVMPKWQSAITNEALASTLEEADTVSSRRFLAAAALINNLGMRCARAGGTRRPHSI